MSKINKINQKKIDSVHKMETFINMKTLKMLAISFSKLYNYQNNSQNQNSEHRIQATE